MQNLPSVALTYFDNPSVEHFTPALVFYPQLFTKRQNFELDQIIEHIKQCAVQPI